MNVSQIKITIFLIRAIDILLLLAVFSVGIYAVFRPENMNLMITVALIGLFFVNALGRFTANKIAVMKAEIERQERAEKKYTL